MRRKLGFVLLVALMIALMPASALFACSANCGNGSCTGTGSCTCETSGAPKCIDQVLPQENLQAQADYAKSFNTPGLNRFADATEKIANALTAGDQDAYFLGVMERVDALKSLSAKEQKILNSWDGGDSRPTGPREK